MASRVENLEAVVKGLQGVGRTLRGAVPVAEMGRLLRGAIRRQLRKQGKGRRYPVPTRGQNVSRRWSHYPKGYRASAPGSPPASPTGNLRRAVALRLNQDKTSATVGVHGSRGVAALAEILEYGRNPRVAARPFVIPTFERERGSLEQKALQQIEKKVMAAQQVLEGKAVAK